MMANISLEPLFAQQWYLPNATPRLLDLNLVNVGKDDSDNGDDTVENSLVNENNLLAAFLSNERQFNDLSSIQTRDFILASSYNQNVWSQTPVEMIDFDTVSLEKIDLESTPIIRDSLFPEAVEYNPNTKRFLLSSQRVGTIFTTTRKRGKKGRVTPFVKDERFITTVGLEIDHQDNLLYVANSDVGLSRNSSPETAFQVAELAIVDLSTKHIVHYVDLDDLRPGEPHFANDIALDGQGNTYVTDSLSPIIYKVDADGEPSILLEDEQFAGEGFNLNGIVYHPDDFLIVSDFNDGLLYKVPLDNPQQFTQIQLDRSLANADGLLLADDDELIVVTNKFNEQNFNQVFNLQSEDNWESAQIVERLDVGNEAFTTAATIRDEEVLVLDGQLDRLFTGEPTDEFAILTVGSIDSDTVNLEKIDLDSIPIIRDNLFPEAVEYNPKTKRFLLSSQGEGTIFTTTRKRGKKGRVYPFVKDERLITTVGLEIDHQDNLLYIANSDVGLSRNSSPETAFQVAELAIVDLTTKDIVHYVDLDDLRPEEPHFANDIALDGQGNAYVTDSLSPIIYKVDADGEPSILLEDEQFAGEGFNLNGIVYHPDDFLIVSDFNDGLLYKVPLDNPQQFTQIQLDRSLANADGLLLADDDELIVVTNKFNQQNFNQVFNLHSEDNWASAKIVERLDVGDEAFTTAATIRDEEILVLDGQLDRLFTGEPTDEFAILTVGSIETHHFDSSYDFMNDNDQQLLANLTGMTDLTNNNITVL